MNSERDEMKAVPHWVIWCNNSASVPQIAIPGSTPGSWWIEGHLVNGVHKILEPVATPEELARLREDSRALVGAQNCAPQWHGAAKLQQRLNAGLEREYSLSQQIADLQEQLRLAREDSIGEYFVRQSEWSANTFGHGTRTLGIVEHIRKELDEVLAAPHDLEEWIDLTMLAMDGFWRHGGDPRDILDHLKAKQAKNFARRWKTPMDGHAVEHVREAIDAARSTEGGKPK